MCFTEPFQLFSDEGIKIIRLDLLRNKVLDKHLQVWERAPCYIGGAEVVSLRGFDFCMTIAAKWE
jgi:hypothetical protein